MKNKIILFTTLFATLLMGCNETSSSNQTSNTSTSDSSLESSTSPISDSSTTITSDTSKEDGSNSSLSSDNSSSEEKSYVQMTIKQANQLCNEIVQNDEVNVTGEHYVSITGRMMFVESNNCTQKGYLSENQYKAFVFDETGYIYVGINAERYKNVFSKYEYSNTSYYTFKGILNKYLGQNELIMEQYEWLNEVPPNLNIDTLKYFANEEKSMNEIYQLDNQLKLNNKGIAYGNVVMFKGKYIDKVENEIALFSNEEYVMRVHGHSKLNNNFNSVKTEEELTNSSSYLVVGVLSMYNYVPEIQYLASEKCSDEINYNLEKANKITANEIWKLKPNKDDLKNKHYQEYENVAQTIHYFEGYVNYSYYSNKYNMVLTDEYVEDYFNSALNEQNEKALRLNNENECGLSDNDLQYSSFANFYLSENGNQKIKVYFVTHGYNTNHYWQIQIINRFNITII